MRNRLFHSATVRGTTFNGILSADGPCISCNETGAGVALGVCALRKFSPDEFRNQPGEFGWWLVKYDNQPRIDLTTFSDAEVERLSDSFGIALLHGDSRITGRVRSEYFFTSPAWEGLCAWTKSHPRLAKQYAARQAYLPGWYERATAAGGLTP